MKNLIYLFVLFPLYLSGQITTENYVKTATYRLPSTSSNTDLAQVNVTYFDGLGRPIQNVAGKASALGKDIITHIQYDAFGRQPKSYLPYPSATDNLAYDSSAEANTVSYYDTPTFENTENPYSEKFYDPSPLNKVKKEGAPGTDWKGNVDNDNDHTIKYAYVTNIAGEVKNLSAIASWSIPTKIYGTTFSDNGSYAAGELYKTIIQDENYATAVNTTASIRFNKEEFRDKDGRLILERSFGSETDSFGMSGFAILNTYYVYDQYDNLTYIIPPSANGTFNEDLCYQYKYDYRNRLVEKKIPGKDWQFIIYDKLDRPVAIGPVNTPFGGLDIGWLITKYDAFGRIAYKGWYQSTTVFNSSARKLMQDNTFLSVTKSSTSTMIDGIAVNYNNSFPTSMKLLSVNYYDNYTFPNAPTSFPTIELQTTSGTALYARGLKTGGWKRALTVASETAGETYYVLYDVKGRPVRNRSTNYLGGYTESDTKMDFDGSVSYTILRHKRLNSSTVQEVTVKDEFTYSSQDRLVAHTHKINNLAPQLMGYNTYNNIGQLILQQVGGTDLTGSAALQFVNFSYTIRGWLKSINDTGSLTSPVILGTLNPSQPQDLFAFRINYNSTVSQNVNGSVRPQYNGNIAETSWRTSSDNIQRRYGYTYDAMNRMTDAWYQMPNAATPLRNSYDEHVTYNLSGNIKNLTRNGNIDQETLVTEIDDLVYTYHATLKDRLLKVSDTSTNPNGFLDVDLNGANDYAYDSNGNLLSDNNRGITSILYNHLSQPVEVSFGSTTKRIRYTYDASGTRLKKTIIDGATTTEIDYLNGFQYQNTVLDFFPTAEGYVKNTVVNNSNNYNYVFNYKDHLGNVRLSYTLDPVDSTLKIMEENHYYPFGLKQQGYNANQNILTDGKGILNPPVILTPVINQAITYKYKYNSQEFESALGLKAYEMDFRQYDPAIARFNCIDALAETMPALSPYQFAVNNPVYFNDPTGLSPGDNDWLRMIADNSAPEGATHWINNNDGSFSSNTGQNVDYNTGQSWSTDKSEDLPEMTYSRNRQTGLKYLGMAFELHVLENGRLYGQWREDRSNAYWDDNQEFLGNLGLVPGVGEVFDVINAGISLGRGNYGDAAISVASALPLAGYFASGVKVKKILSNAELIQKTANKAEAAIGGSGRFAGSAKHKYAKNLLNRYQRIYGDRGLSLEHYFNTGNERGFLDVLDVHNKTIYDYKFGGATMSTKQFSKYSNAYQGFKIEIVRPN